MHGCQPGGHDILLPSLFTAGIALLFLIPLAIAAWQVGREASSVILWLREARAHGLAAPDALARLPWIGASAAAWWTDNLGDAAHAEEFLRSITHTHVLPTGRVVGVEIFHRFALFGFTLLALFFLFRDGAHLAERLLGLSHRLFGPSGERVGRQVIASIHGTVDGLVLVGLGVGAIMGVAYAIAGVPHPALLGVLTAIGAMVPFGAPVVFCIAALLLAALSGAVLAAAVIVALGAATTFIADHFIRPALIGGATRLPFLWVLLGILGGIETWGLVGLFLGPAVMAALILLWREWTEGRG